MPNEKKIDQDFAVANELADVFISACNLQRAKMLVAEAFDSSQFIAGVCLALKALERSMPPTKPPGLQRLLVAGDECLNELREMQKRRRIQTRLN